MNIRKMPKEELELMSYADIAYEILKQDKQAKATPDLFGDICKMLEIDEDTMYEMIGDFYTALTTDKRFILLDDAKWDLKENHVVKTIIEEDEEEDLNQEQEEIPEEAEDDAVMSKEEDYDDDDDSDDLDDLEIITEEDLEE